MSVFSNPASGAAGQAAAYVAAVVELVGDRDALAILEETLGVVRSVLGELAPERVSGVEAEGKWSINQVVQHLADSELVWGYRLRRVLAEEGPRLEGFDQDLWAVRLGYAQADPEVALQMFEALRRANLELLRGAGPEGLLRHAVHEERGRETLEHMTKLYAGHDLVHRRQIERIRRATAP